MAQAFVYHSTLPERLDPGFQFKIDILLTGNDVRMGSELLQGLVQLTGAETDVGVSNAIIAAVQLAAQDIGLVVASKDITLPTYQRPIT